MTPKHLHYITSCFLPGIRANKIQVVSMAKAFANLQEISEVLFYFMINDQSKLIELRKQFPLKVTLKPIYLLGYQDRISQTGIKPRWVDRLRNRWIVLLFLNKFLFTRFGSDLVYIRGEKPLVALYLAGCLGRKISFAFELHNFEFKKENGRLKNHIYKTLMQKAAYIVAISKYTKENWVKHGITADKIQVLPSAVDLDQYDSLKENRSILRQKLNLPSDKKIILFSGSFHRPWKVLQTLIGAATYLTDEYLIVIVGGNEKEIAPYKALIQSSGLQNIHFMGYKPHSVIPKYLKAADLLVIPTTGKEDIGKYHTSPIKLFEYMASQTPILASDLPSLRQFVTEQEVTFFEADNPQDLAHKIKKMMSDQKIIQKIKLAYKTVRRNTWQKRSKSIILSLQ